MWIRANPNPGYKNVPDCVIRAISIALNQSWLKVYDDLSDLARRRYNMPSSDKLWGEYLYEMGFEPFKIPDVCPMCVTVRMFCKMYPFGIYIIGTGSHAVAVVDGDYYDSWDSGNEIPSFFWRIST